MRVTQKHHTDAVHFASVDDIGTIADFCGPLLQELKLNTANDAKHYLRLTINGDTGSRPSSYTLTLHQECYLLRNYRNDFFVRTAEEFREEWEVLPCQS